MEEAAPMDGGGTDRSWGPAREPSGSGLRYLMYNRKKSRNCRPVTLGINRRDAGYRTYEIYRTGVRYKS